MSSVLLELAFTGTVVLGVGWLCETVAAGTVVAVLGSVTEVA